MAKKSVTFDVKVNTPSAQQEAQRVAKIFQGALSKVQVGTQAGKGGAGSGGGGGGGGGSSGGMLVRLATVWPAMLKAVGLKLLQHLPEDIMNIDRIATAVAPRLTATIAGGAARPTPLLIYMHGTGSVAPGEAMIVQLFNLGLAINANAMQKFTTVSRGTAQATGKDVGYIQEQFSLAMANQSLLRFDQLGLSITRHKEIMADLQKQYPGMTREIAFQNAMLQQATEKYYDLATAQEALATSSEVVGRAARQMQEDMATLIQERGINPLMAQFARATGQTDMGLFLPDLAASRDAHRRDLAQREQAGGPGALERYQAFFHGQWSMEGQQQVYQQGMQQLRTKIASENTMLGLGGKMAAAETMGVKIPDQWRDQFARLNQAVADFGVVTPQMTEQIDNLSSAVDFQVGVLKDQTAANDAVSASAEGAAAAVESFAGELQGIGAKLVGQLLDRGVSPKAIMGMAPTDEDIDNLMNLYKEQAMLQGGYVSEATARWMAEKTLFGEMETTVDNIDDANRAAEKAARASESAAEKWEKTVATTANKLRDVFSSMLHQIPGLFSPSEVTESDLYLAKKGYAINKPDDWFRRLSDIALNKSKRTDVDLSVVARAVGHPEETDPMALMYLAQQGMADMSVYSNPELANQLINPDAVKAGLHGLEMSQLGTQTVEAMFGAGTTETNEYLRVFGVKALDPIRDGLISEITTKGPQMGGMIADAMHEGFKDQAAMLPWVADLMKVMTEQVGRGIAQEQAANVTSDLATAEVVPYTATTTGARLSR
jgi:hypothetical protein